MGTDISNLLRLEVWDVVVSQNVFQSFNRDSQNRYPNRGKRPYVFWRLGFFGFEATDRPFEDLAHSTSLSEVVVCCRALGVFPI